MSQHLKPQFHVLQLVRYLEQELQEMNHYPWIGSGCHHSQYLDFEAAASESDVSMYCFSCLGN